MELLASSETSGVSTVALGPFALSRCTSGPEASLAPEMHKTGFIHAEMSCALQTPGPCRGILSCSHLEKDEMLLFVWSVIVTHLPYQVSSWSFVSTSCGKH